MKFRIIFSFCFILKTLSGWADVDIDSQDIGLEQIEKPARRTPFSLNTHIDAIGNSKINKGFFKGDEVRYATSQVEAGMIVYYCPSYTEGLRLAIGFTPTYLRWESNPWFDQEHFNTLSLSVTGFSKRLDRWFWRSQFTINFDADKWDSEHISYDLLLWGRYSYSDNFGIHIGFLGETGLQMDRVYPVFGFDWQISRKWKLNLVYPVNIAMEYSLTPKWTLAIGGRFFNSRFRTHHNSQFKPLVRYTNTGAEFVIKYDDETMSANIHAGSTLGGKYRVANSHNHHAQTFHLDPSAYVGGEIDVKF